MTDNTTTSLADLILAQCKAAKQDDFSEVYRLQRLIDAMEQRSKREPIRLI